MPQSQWLPNPRIVSGGAALGDLLTGNVGTPGVYDDTVRGRYDSERALQQARRERSLAMIDGVRAQNYQQIPTMGPELGITDAQARLMAAGGGNFQQMTSGLGNLQGQGFRRAAVESAALGDVQGANAQLFGVANGPVQVTGISDGVAYNRLAAPGEADLTVTPLGEATIRQRDASANASHARAASTRARLGIAQEQFGLQKSGQWNPSGNVAPSAGGNRTQPNEAALKRAFETTTDEWGGAEFDQDRYLDFMRWWEQSPIADGNQALAQYQIAASGRGLEPVFADPSMPGQPRPPSLGAPRPGEVMQGYRFKGGDPGDRDNWERI